nr:GAF domain-containing protein [Phototrophicaceae bacterium]
VAIAHAATSEFNRHPAYIEFKLEAYIGTVLTIRNQIYGTVNFSSLNPHSAFTPGDRTFVHEISRLVAQILES